MAARDNDVAELEALFPTRALDVVPASAMVPLERVDLPMATRSPETDWPTLFSPSTYLATEDSELVSVDLKLEVAELLAQTMNGVQPQERVAVLAANPERHVKTMQLDAWFDMSAHATEPRAEAKLGIFVPPMYPMQRAKRVKTTRPEHGDDDAAASDAGEEPHDAVPSVVDSIVLPKGGALDLMRDLNLCVEDGDGTQPNADDEHVSLESRLVAALAKLDLPISDTDPSALRSDIRLALERGNAHLVAPLVALHVVRVADALSNDPSHLCSFVEYCLDPGTGYENAMGKTWEPQVAAYLQPLADAAKSKLSKAETAPGLANVRLTATTIAVDASQVCVDATLRSTVHALESELNVRVVERELGVSMLLDGKTACALMALGNQLAATDVNSMTSGLAKWLACEAHRLDAVTLVIVTAHAANALVRAAVRSVASAVGLLVAPAPRVVMRLATSPVDAARLVRAACDELGAAAHDWYRARNDLADSLDAHEAAAVHFVAEFPGMTALVAETIVLREGVAPSQLLLGNDAAPFANAWTGPLLAPAPSVAARAVLEGGEDPYHAFTSRRLAVDPRPGMKKGEQKKLQWVA